MTMLGKLGPAAALAFALAACADSGADGRMRPIAAPSAAPDVSDIRGAQAAAGGATALAERGYVIARRQGGTRYWWHERSRQCLQVVTINGRYRAIDPAAPADCGR